MKREKGKVRKGKSEKKKKREKEKREKEKVRNKNHIIKTQPDSFAMYIIQTAS